ncbi:MAG: helix-turn-helix domain-containing protein [Acidobacteria bacterium]|nr:helix-turn-helix domain-containing protein [Acidobacteriota bacterium]
MQQYYCIERKKKGIANLEEVSRLEASMEQILVSRLDAAKALSISVRGLDYLIAQGKIPVRKLGKRTLIPRAALERFSRGSEAAPEAAPGAARQ